MVKNYFNFTPTPNIYIKGVFRISNVISVVAQLTSGSQWILSITLAFIHIASYPWRLPLAWTLTQPEREIIDINDLLQKNQYINSSLEGKSKLWRYKS